MISEFLCVSSPHLSLAIVGFPVSYTLNRTVYHKTQSQQSPVIKWTLGEPTQPIQGEDSSALGVSKG